MIYIKNKNFNIEIFFNKKLIDHNKHKVLTKVYYIAGVYINSIS